MPRFIPLALYTPFWTNRASVGKGWELISIMLQFFPPSNLFFDYLQSFVFYRLKGKLRDKQIS